MIFTADGREIAKRRGYIPPARMAALLRAILRDPAPEAFGAAPETPAAEDAFLSPAQRRQIEEEHVRLYDRDYGGWGVRVKLLDEGNVERAILKARSGDPAEAAMARRTLDQALNLLDPVWGGFYQYSDERDWKSPHYEKIMAIQSSYVRLYAMAYGVWGDAKYLAAAEAAARYAADFWRSPEGAFFTSQDADASETMKGEEFYSKDAAARRALGTMPRIDRHLYSRENGWMISALAALYGATGDERWLSLAEESAEWIVRNRSLPGGGFRHDEQDRAGPYLDDTLAMGRAFLDLYGASAERKWLSRAESAARFIGANFADDSPAGYVSARVPPGARGVFARPVKEVDENVSAARFANLLYQYTGQEEYKSMAARAMKYLASPAALGGESFSCGILIADEELAADPLHVTVVGGKADPAAKALFAQALRCPVEYKRLEWWDPAEGALPNPGVAYPPMEKAAAFLCADRACSLPVFAPEKLSRLLSNRAPAGAPEN